MQNKRPINEKGERHGHWEVYNDNGKLIYKGLYINGKAFGKHESFNKDGNWYYIKHFINSERHGYSQYKHAKMYYAR